MFLLISVSNTGQVQKKNEMGYLRNMESKRGASFSE